MPYVHRSAQGGSIINTNYPFELSAHFKKNHNNGNLLKVVITLEGRHGSLEMLVSARLGFIHTFLAPFASFLRVD